MLKGWTLCFCYFSLFIARELISLSIFSPQRRLGKLSILSQICCCLCAEHLKLVMALEQMIDVSHWILHVSSIIANRSTGRSIIHWKYRLKCLFILEVENLATYLTYILISILEVSTPPLYLIIIHENKMF